jgi:tetratricopeptide (TPR) repeat protein
MGIGLIGIGLIGIGLWGTGSFAHGQPLHQQISSAEQISAGQKAPASAPASESSSTKLSEVIRPRAKNAKAKQTLACLELIQGQQNLASFSLQKLLKTCEPGEVLNEVLDVALLRWLKIHDFSVQETKLGLKDHKWWPFLWRFSVTSYCREDFYCQNLRGKLLGFSIPESMDLEIQQHVFSLSDYSRRKLFLSGFLGAERSGRFKKFGKDPQFIYWSARAHANAHQWNEAGRRLKSFVKKHQKHPLLPKVYEMMALVAKRLGQREKSPHFLQKAVDATFEQPPHCLFTEEEEWIELSFSRWLIDEKIPNFSSKKLASSKPSRCYRKQKELLQVRQIQSLWNRDQNEKALTKIAKLSPKIKDQEAKAELISIHAGILAEEDKHHNAIQLLASTRSNWMGTEVEADLHANYAWWHYRLENFSDAAKHFKDLRFSSKAEKYRMFALFFRARSLEALGKKSKAKKLFKTLIRINPQNYYALKARHELYKDRQGEKSPLLANYEALERSPDQSIQSARFSLSSWGRKKWLLHIIEKQIQIGEKEIASLLLNRLSLENRGIYEKQTKALAKHLNEWDLLHQYGWEFPLAYSTKVDKASKKLQVDPAFTYSIMRQESRFNPFATSFASARGLLQLTWRTAKKRADEKKINLTDPNQLYVIDTNLVLGISEMAHLKNLYGSNLVAIAAGYNAGTAATSKWMRRHQNESLENFVEMIPYRETRNYVKKVSENYAIYRSLRNESSGEYVNPISRPMFMLPEN